MGKIYCGKEFQALSEKLSSEELYCLGYCGAYDDCSNDGDCRTQEKAKRIIKELKQ